MKDKSAAKSRTSIGIVIAGMLIASCGTSLPTAEDSSVGNLADVDAADDPNRIVCKSYTPAGTERAEKICMTAGQWEKKNSKKE